MPNEELGNDEKQTVASEDQQQRHINALNFLQSQIAKYYGNDGILSSKEKEELEKLYGTLGIKKDQYDRLVEIAKDEIRNFKKFDVVSFLLEREDKLKLYSDAERLSIRISRVERWISELKGIITPKEDEKVNKREILIEKMKKIMKWFDQELYVETNTDIGNLGESLKENSENELDDDKHKLVADEIDDFMNDEKNLAWRSYCKQILLKKLRNESNVELKGKLNEVFKGITEKGKSKSNNDENQKEPSKLKKVLDKVLGILKKVLGALKKGLSKLKKVVVKVLDKLKGLFTKKNGDEENKSSDNDTVDEETELGNTKIQYKDLNKFLEEPIKKSDKKEPKKKNLKEYFDDAVEEYAKQERLFEEEIKKLEEDKLAENATIENIKEAQKRIDEIKETLKKLDEIKVRIRQYFDIKKLFDKNGYKESKTEIDFQVHLNAALLYIIVVVLCFGGIGGVFFRNLDMIHKYIEGEKNFNIDGVRFTTVDINGVQWMVENLNHELDSCHSCKPSKLAKNGGLFYSLDEAIKACPSGWRLPTFSEWQALIDYFGNDSIAAYSLKSRSLWDDDTKGSDSVGFSALPAGLYNVSSHSLRETNSASWWTYSMKNEKEAYVVKVGSNARIRIAAENIGQDYHSVRCVKMEAGKVPCVSNVAKWSDSETSKTFKNGTVIGLSGGANLPIVLFPRGRPEAIYDSSKFAKLVKAGDLLNFEQNFPEQIFSEQANVDLTRYYKIVYYWNGEVWKDSTLWSEDSVKVSGVYKILDLDTSDSLCRIGFNPLGADSATAYVSMQNSCDSLRKGDEYQIQAYYNIFERRRVADNCAENESLSYRFVKAEIHAR